MEKRLIVYYDEAYYPDGKMEYVSLDGVGPFPEWCCEKMEKAFFGIDSPFGTYGPRMYITRKRTNDDDWGPITEDISYCPFCGSKIYYELHKKRKKVPRTISHITYDDVEINELMEK